MEEENKIIVEEITTDTIAEEEVQQNLNIDEKVVKDEVIDQDVQVVKQLAGLNSLEFSPSDGKLTYVDDIATYIGLFTYTTTQQPDVPVSISGKISFNIASGNGIDIDINETSSKITIALNSEVVTSLETIKSDLDQLSKAQSADSIAIVEIQSKNLTQDEQILNLQTTKAEQSDFEELSKAQSADSLAIVSLESKTLTHDEQISELQTNKADRTDIDAINNKIPTQASETNQLADKSFVNSSVQTATANFRGNWTSWDNVPADSMAYPEDYTGSTTPTVNDYLVVQDASDYTEETLSGTWRFKYSGTWSANGKNGWLPEYQVNEVPLTSAQLLAINSGITNDLVNQITTNKNDITELKNADTNLQEQITTNTDDIARNMADIASNLQKINDLENTKADRTEIPTTDEELSLTSTNPVQNKVVTNALTNVTTTIGDIQKSIPTKTSDLINDSGFISQESDPTVPDWAKQPTKPTYDYSEIQNTPNIPTGATLYDTTGQNTDGAMTQKATTDELNNKQTQIDTLNANLTSAINTAQSTANTAQSTAETANTNAQNAQTTADTALSTADTALTTANGAVSKNAEQDTSISALQTADGQNVKLTGDQTISGLKTFKNVIILETQTGTFLQKIGIDSVGRLFFDEIPYIVNQPIVSSGSNANGHWVRFADGTQICYNVLTYSSTGDQTITLPQPFIDTNYVVSWSFQDTESSSQVSFRVMASTNKTTSTFINRFIGKIGYIYIAIGKWK